MVPFQIRILRVAPVALGCLLVGLAVNFAAPAVWLRLRVPATWWLVHDYGRRPWPHVVPADWPPDCNMMEHFRSWFSDQIGLAVPDGFEMQPDRTGQLPAGSSLRLYGWPCRSVRSWSLIWGYAPPVVANSDIYIDHGQLGGFPCSIVWRGMLINTVLYATALMGLRAVVIRTVQGGRRRRRLCTRCSYPLEGLEQGTTCPECGLTDSR